MKRGKGILKEKKATRELENRDEPGVRNRSAIEGSAGRKQSVGEEIWVAGGGTEDLEREQGKCKELGSCRKG